MTVRGTLTRLRNMDIELPRDPRAIETLVASGLILSGLALADLVHRRFRVVAYGACGLLAASALTGFSPLSSLARRRDEAALQDENGDGANGDDEAGDDEPRYLPARSVGVPPIASLGVPHRIPYEVALERPRRDIADPRPADRDDRPAPSVDGDLGLSD